MPGRNEVPRNLAERPQDRRGRDDSALPPTLHEDKESLTAERCPNIIYEVAISLDTRSRRPSATRETLGCGTLTAIEWPGSPRDFTDLDVFQVVFTPDGRRLATPSQNSIRLWDLSGI